MSYYILQLLLIINLAHVLIESVGDTSGSGGSISIARSAREEEALLRRLGALRPMVVSGLGDVQLPKNLDKVGSPVIITSRHHHLGIFIKEHVQRYQITYCSSIVSTSRRDP